MAQVSNGIDQSELAVLQRLGLGRTLALAYAVGALRWALLAELRAPWLVVAVQCLHALSFGAFYLAAVASVDEDSPAAVRASAQGVFGALVWGLSTSIALASAGYLQRHGGMPTVFRVASGCGVAASALALYGHRARRGPRR